MAKWAMYPDWSVEEFVYALDHIRLTDNNRRILQAFLDAPEHTLTAHSLAEAAVLKGGWTAANLRIGELARKFAPLLGLLPDLGDGDPHWWRYIASGEWRDGHFHWTLWPALKAALLSLQEVESEVELAPARSPLDVRHYIYPLRVMDYGGELTPEWLNLLRWHVTSENLCASTEHLALVTGLTAAEVEATYQRTGKRLGELMKGVRATALPTGWKVLATKNADKWCLYPSFKKALDVLELLVPDETSQYTLAVETLLRRKKLAPDSTNLNLLQAHYSAPYFDVTAGQLAELMEWVSFAPANLFYGKLGALFSEFLGASPVTYDQDPSKDMTVAHLVTFWHDGEAWHWVMRKGLRRALEVTGLVTPRPQESPMLAQFSALPYTDPNALTEIAADAEEEHFWEGHVQVVRVNKYERNLQARRKCISHFGPQCQVCQVRLTDIYGPLALEYIQVHHLRPISEIGERYKVDPLTDLIPVCPNCHAMLHRDNPPLSVEKLQELMEQARKARRD